MDFLPLHPSTGHPVRPRERIRLQGEKWTIQPSRQTRQVSMSEALRKKKEEEEEEKVNKVNSHYYSYRDELKCLTVFGLPTTR